MLRIVLAVVVLGGCAERHYWHETARVHCVTGGAIGITTQPVQELRFDPDDIAYVTFQPFETYTDYQGRYVMDEDTGAFALIDIGGAGVPLDFDGTGTFAYGEDEFGERTLILKNVWLGSVGAQTKPPTVCGQIFSEGAVFDGR